MLFHFVADPTSLFHHRVILDHISPAWCGTLPSLKRSLARPGLHCWTDYQFDFVPSFVISVSGDSCQLCMHKSRSQGSFASDLLPAENLDVSVCGCGSLPVFQQNCLCGSLCFTHLYVFRHAQLYIITATFYMLP